jgi:hypothetical protein
MSLHTVSEWNWFYYSKYLIHTTKVKQEMLLTKNWKRALTSL